MTMKALLLCLFIVLVVANVCLEPHFIVFLSPLILRLVIHGCHPSSPPLASCLFIFLSSYYLCHTHVIIIGRRREREESNLV